MANVSDTAGGADHAHDHAHLPFMQHHFDTPTQQFNASKLGMWVFIATEILMFGGLFCAYAVERGLEPQIFDEAHHFLNKIMGASNTVVLLFSSLTAALAVRSAQVGKRNLTSFYLVVTILCACVFLVIKYFEYSHKFHLGLLPGHCFGHPGLSQTIQNGQEVGTCLHVHADAAQVSPEWVRAVDEEGHVTLLPPRAAMFFGLYFVMTGLHGLHVLIGMSILTWVLVKNIRGKFSPAYFTPVDLGALYWHLVDLVWIYLFPLLYLVGEAGVTMAADHSHAHDHDDDGAVHVHIASNRFYIGIFAALICLTIATVKVSYYDFGSANILIALVIATTKAGLVAAFFMHLRHDKLFNTLAFLASFLFLGIFILLTYDDVGVRARSRTDYSQKVDLPSGALAPGGLPATSATADEAAEGHAAPGAHEK